MSYMGVKICLLYHEVILLVISPNDVNLMVFVIVSHIKVVNNRVGVHSMKRCYHAGLCEPGLLLRSSFSRDLRLRFSASFFYFLSFLCLRSDSEEEYLFWSHVCASSCGCHSYVGCVFEARTSVTCFFFYFGE